MKGIYTLPYVYPSKTDQPRVGCGRTQLGYGDCGTRLRSISNFSLEAGRVCSAEPDLHTISWVTLGSRENLGFFLK